MGQINFNGQKPKYCNLQAIQSGGSKADYPIPNGEVWMVDTTNSLKTNGTGKYDSYIVGDGITAASELVVYNIEDKEYDSTKFNGLGKKVLSKNIIEVNGANKNVLTQAMMNTANTIYHIQYDYDLNGQTITLPAGCVLEFDGGSVKNGTVEGQNTVIKETTDAHFMECTLTGSFVGRGKSKWFKREMSDADIISSVLAFDEVEFDGETFSLSSPTSVSKALSVYGNFVSFNYTGSGFCFTFSNNIKVNNVNITSADGGISVTSPNAELLGCSITTESLVSEAISCTCNKTLIEECSIEGGMRCLYISGSGTAPTAIVRNSTFKSSTKYDNVHLLNLSGGKVYNNISSDSQRSGIVIGENVENIDIFNNKCTDNKVDSNSQGGWGIVATYLSKKCRIYSNSLLDNEVGGITADLAGGSDDTYYDAEHIIYSNYIKNGKDGIRLYKSYKSIVCNNIIDSVWYGILISASHGCLVNDNIIYSDSDVDINNTYGIQVNGSNKVVVNGNVITLINGKRTYCIGVNNANYITLGNNEIRLEEGGNVYIFDMANTCTNIVISNNSITRTAAANKYSSFAIIRASSDVTSYGNVVRGTSGGFQNIYNIKGNDASLISYGNIFGNVVNRAFIEGTTYTGLSIKVSDTYKGIIYSIPSKSGTFADKPAAADVYVGYTYFCTDRQTAEGTTDGIEITYKGSDVWVDALGRVVS